MCARVICQRILSHFGAGDFPFNTLFKKCFKIVFLKPLASRSGFGAAICSAFARSCSVLCNSISMSADGIVMAA